MKHKINLLIILLSIISLGFIYYKAQIVFIKPQDKLGHIQWKNDVPSIQMYFAIKKYSKK